MANKTIQKWYQRWQLVTSIESAWRWLPAPIRGIIRIILAPLAAIAISLWTGLLLWGTGFLQEYWALAILSILSGIGASVILVRPINSLVARLEEVIRKRTPVRKHSVMIQTAVDMLPLLHENRIDILVHFLDGPKRINVDWGHAYEQTLAMRELRDLYLIVKVADSEWEEVWKINPEMEEIVREFLQDLIRPGGRYDS